MGRRYQNSPIIEALCEFRFESHASWDLAIPGLVFHQLRETFPVRRTVEFPVMLDADTVRSTPEYIQFVRQDETALVQLGQGVLTVNHLKPYPTWNEFAPMIRRAFDVYREVAQPKALQSVTLRYINRIEIPESDVDLQEYLQFYPFLGPHLPQTINAFIVGAQVPFDDERDALRLQLTSTASGTPTMATFILDLNYSLANAGAVSLDSVFNWIDQAHLRIEDAFEACVTDKLRAIFGEERGR